MTGSGSSPESSVGLLGQAGVSRQVLVNYFRRRVRDRNDAEDLVQEVYLRIAARKVETIVDNPGGYLMQTAVSVLADYQRRRTVRHANDHVAFEGEQHGGRDFDAGQILESRETLRAVAASLETLPERTRLIFMLRRLDGVAYKDIATRLGISVSAIEKHMERAIHHLLNTPGCS